MSCRLRVCVQGCWPEDTVFLIIPTSVGPFAVGRIFDCGFTLIFHFDCRMYMPCMYKHLWRAEDATAPPELGVTKSHGPLGPGSLERAGSPLNC